MTLRGCCIYIAKKWRAEFFGSCPQQVAFHLARFHGVNLQIISWGFSVGGARAAAEGAWLYDSFVSLTFWPAFRWDFRVKSIWNFESNYLAWCVMGLVNNYLNRTSSPAVAVATIWERYSSTHACYSLPKTKESHLCPLSRLWEFLRSRPIQNPYKCLAVVASLSFFTWQRRNSESKLLSRNSWTQLSKIKSDETIQKGETKVLV
jgi:hypothetical protein